MITIKTESQIEKMRKACGAIDPLGGRPAFV